MLTKWLFSFVLAATLAAPAAALARPPQRDFLTQTEADKIRDAESANERVKLFLDFAAGRGDAEPADPAAIIDRVRGATIAGSAAASRHDADRAPAGGSHHESL